MELISKMRLMIWILGIYLKNQSYTNNNKKKLVLKPPTYEESLQDILSGNKEIYVEPKYFPQEAQELPPEYDDDNEIEYALKDEDMNNEILNDLGIQNYDSVDKVLNQPGMTQQKNRKYLRLSMRLKQKKSIKRLYHKTIQSRFNVYSCQTNGKQKNRQCQSDI